MELEGRVTYLGRKAGAAAACRRMPRTTRDTASTIGTLAASVPRRLHVWRTLTLQNRAFAKRVKLALKKRVTYLGRIPEAAAACARMPRTPRDTASPIGTLAASVPRRLHVCRTPNFLKSGFR